MLETILIAGLVSMVTGLLGYVIGGAKGRADKLNELHELQEEGWLSITYRGDPNKSVGDSPKRPVHSGRDANEEKDVIDLMFKDEPKVTRSRRDAEERRTDWAKHMKARKRADADADDASDDVEDDE